MQNSAFIPKDSLTKLKSKTGWDCFISPETAAEVITVLQVHQDLILVMNNEIKPRVSRQIWLGY